MAYHSNGGFSHDEIYNMPIVKRRHYLKLLLEEKKKEEDKIEKNKQGVSPGRIPKLPTPKNKKPR